MKPVHMLLAETNVGKTFYLVHKAVKLAKQGKKILFVNTELYIDSLITRFASYTGSDDKDVPAGIEIVTIGLNDITDIHKYLKNEYDVIIIDTPLLITKTLVELNSLLEHCASVSEVIFSHQLNREACSKIKSEDELKYETVISPLTTVSILVRDDVLITECFYDIVKQEFTGETKSYYMDNNDYGSPWLETLNEENKNGAWEAFFDSIQYMWKRILV